MQYLRSTSRCCKTAAQQRTQETRGMKSPTDLVAERDALAQGHLRLHEVPSLFLQRRGVPETHTCLFPGQQLAVLQRRLQAGQGGCYELLVFVDPFGMQRHGHVVHGGACLVETLLCDRHHDWTRVDGPRLGGYGGRFLGDARGPRREGGGICHGGMRAGPDSRRLASRLCASDGGVDGGMCLRGRRLDGNGGRVRSRPGRALLRRRIRCSRPRAMRASQGDGRRRTGRRRLENVLRVDEVDLLLCWGWRFLGGRSRLTRLRRKRCGPRSGGRLLLLRCCGAVRWLWAGLLLVIAMMRL